MMKISYNFLFIPYPIPIYFSSSKPIFLKVIYQSKIYFYSQFFNLTAKKISQFKKSLYHIHRISKFLYQSTNLSILDKHPKLGKSILFSNFNSTSPIALATYLLTRIANYLYSTRRFHCF